MSTCFTKMYINIKKIFNFLKEEKEEGGNELPSHVSGINEIFKINYFCIFFFM